jgi:hypothetical protein
VVIRPIRKLGLWSKNSNGLKWRGDFGSLGPLVDDGFGDLITLGVPLQELVNDESEDCQDGGQPVDRSPRRSGELFNEKMCPSWLFALLRVLRY